jgi:hypothetical protein
LAEPLVIGRRINLLAASLALLDLLQIDHISVVTQQLGDRVFQTDGSLIGLGSVPDLAELHVELQDSKWFHAMIQEQG